jgi:hypothetical protein
MSGGKLKLFRRHGGWWPEGLSICVECAERNGALKAEGDGKQRRSHHHRLDVRPRNRGSIHGVVRLVRLGRLNRRR